MNLKDLVVVLQRLLAHLVNRIDEIGVKDSLQWAPRTGQSWRDRVQIRHIERRAQELLHLLVLELQGV